MDWEEAIRHYEKLFSESKWSKSVYAYQLAAMMCMTNLTEEEKEKQISLMK